MKLKTEPTPPKVAAPQRIILQGSLSKAEQSAINKAGLKCSSIADSFVPAATEQADPAQGSNSLQLVTKNKNARPRKQRLRPRKQRLSTKSWIHNPQAKVRPRQKPRPNQRPKQKQRARPRQKPRPVSKPRGSAEQQPAAEKKPEPQHDNNDDTALEKSQPGLQPGSPPAGSLPAVPPP